ncbi:MAG TPA: DUF2809 domain-containing protein [Leucothrix mucor]|uniref:DUF2809 domain-containing protein n=1 Tax=Leucothrix mucor TaxID=45248 RepID=A0A7V2WV52_LEUMU|nr:DUF2809 domain-containing protein [Leucothrix mucor]
MSKLTYATLAIILFITEVIIATKLNDYHFIRHYIGDFLVVILLYFMLKVVINVSSKPLAISIFIFATVVEIAQYFHLADQLGLAQGGLARIVIGTSFSVSDLVMYALGCIVVYWFDLLVIRKLQER